VGNYFAKYATKSLDAPGLPDRPLRSARDLADLRCHRHYKQMITTWELGGGVHIPARLRGTDWELGHGRLVDGGLVHPYPGLSRSGVSKSVSKFRWLRLVVTVMRAREPGP
jgi:hypothetical protein